MRWKVRQRRSHASKFSKVSSLLNVLCNITVRLTFENVYYVEGAEVALARIKILKSQLAARFPV